MTSVTNLQSAIHGGIGERKSVMAVSDWRVLREVPVVFARMGMMLSKYRVSEKRRGRIDLLLKIRSERDMLLLPCEACQVMSLVDAVKNVPGDMAELGVARGASAKMIAARAPDRVLHLFDTFEGLPDPSAQDGARFKKRQYRHTLEEVQGYLDSGNLRFYKGLFPETASDLSTTRFAFVHLDADLYESTRAGLEWFYPRLNRGGILVSHDYDTSSGVNLAFEQFFADKPEPYFDLVGSQCMFVKM
jgi:O-methyltransferase